MLNPAAAAAAGNSFLPSLTNASSSKSKSSGSTPSISITPLPRQQQQAGIKPGQSPNSSGGKPQFVICEICDGYIKDLDQLRNHMQWIHKVKVRDQSEFPKNFLCSSREILTQLWFSLDSSQDDLQSTTVELSKVSISLLHRSRSRTTSSRVAWTCHELNAGSRQQWEGFGTLPGVWKGKFKALNVEASAK